MNFWKTQNMLESYYINSNSPILSAKTMKIMRWKGILWFNFTLPSAMLQASVRLLYTLFLTLLLQARSQEFLRAGKVSENQGTNFSQFWEIKLHANITARFSQK